METKILHINGDHDTNKLREAARLLRSGEVVAFPTETVYGLGADARNDQAIAKIFTAKGRPSDNPLIVHVATKIQLQSLVEPYPPYVDKLIASFSPGPITYVLKSKGKVAKNVTANLTTVGVRIPNNDVALALLKEVNIPIAAPSANVSGKPSPTKASHVQEDLHGKIAAIVDADASEVGVESTVIDCTQEVPLILRVGTVTKEQIEAVIGTVHMLNKEEVSAKPKSPGLKYKHYAPDVPLILVENSAQLQSVIDEKMNKGLRVGVIVEENQAKNIQATKLVPVDARGAFIANQLYDILRSFKKTEVDVIISQAFSTEGVGLAVMDRLTRAATSIITSK